MKYLVRLDHGYFSHNHAWTVVELDKATSIDTKKEARRIASRLSSGKFRYITEVEPDERNLPNNH